MEGGDCLALATEPLFRFKAEKKSVSHSKTDYEIPFAAQSPAGILLGQYAEIIQNWKLQWIDPYHTPIGVGSSSAQFLLTVEFINSLLGKQESNAEEILKLYWDCVGSSQGLRPSGVDIVSQHQGGVVSFSNKPFRLERLGVLASSAQFILAFTGSKAKTHEHLLKLQSIGFPQNKKFQQMLMDLRELMREGKDFWQNLNYIDFGKTMNSYQSVLSEYVESPGTYREKIATIQSWQHVWGAKGCGAQGGDSVLVLAAADKISGIEEKIRCLGWEPYRVVTAAIRN